jgi:hypothetical protein
MSDVVALPYTVALLLVVYMLVGWLLSRRRGQPPPNGGSVAYAQAERERADRLERRVNVLLDHIFKLNRLLASCCPGTSVPLPPLVEDAPATPLTQTERSVWRRLLVTRLSHDDLCNAAFDLGLDVAGVTSKSEIARRLLEYLDDRGKMDLLRRWMIANDRQDVLNEIKE